MRTSVVLIPGNIIIYNIIIFIRKLYRRRYYRARRLLLIIHDIMFLWFHLKRDIDLNGGRNILIFMLTVLRISEIFLSSSLYFNNLKTRLLQVAVHVV